VFRGLELPRPGLALVLAALGTPFFFYVTMQPAKTHTVEPVLFALVVALLWRTSAPSSRSAGFARARRRDRLSATVRYTNAAQAGPSSSVCSSSDAGGPRSRWRAPRS